MHNNSKLLTSTWYLLRYVVTEGGAKCSVFVTDFHVKSDRLLFSINNITAFLQNLIILLTDKSLLDK